MVMQEPAPCLRPDPISIWYWASNTIRWGKCSRIELVSQYPFVTNQTTHRAREILCDCLHEVPLNPSSFGYFPVEMSLAAFGITQGRYEEHAYAHQMLSVIVWLQPCRFGALQLPQPSIHSFRTAYLSHRTSRRRPPIQVVSVHQALSASTESSPWGALPFWRLCPSPSQVHHLRSACQALDVLHHHPHHPHPPDVRNLQDRSDCPR